MRNVVFEDVRVIGAYIALLHSAVQGQQHLGFAAAFFWCAAEIVRPLLFGACVSPSAAACVAVAGLG